jgi:hypothetical protein
MKKIAKAMFLVIAVAALVVSCASSGGASGGSSGAGAKIKLQAKDAELAGKEITFEDANQNVGWWSDTGDTAKWNLEVAEAGTYMVQVQYSCTESQPGSVVDITIGDSALEWTVASTSDWASYKKVDIGTVDLAAGTVPVMMQAKSIKTRFVANVATLIFVKQ